MRPLTGYAFVLQSVDCSDWRVAPDDDWEIEVVVAGDICSPVHVGRRRIDGTMCDVWHCDADLDVQGHPDLSTYVAQVAR